MGDVDVVESLLKVRTCPPAAFKKRFVVHPPQFPALFLVVHFGGLDGRQVRRLELTPPYRY
jgi:hypothetical protein